MKLDSLIIKGELMAFCSACGNEIKDSVKFCQDCGETQSQSDLLMNPKIGLLPYCLVFSWVV
jgi:predicted amidophosphoribosyltransferase